MSDAPLVFYATSLAARLAAGAFGLAAIAGGIALLRGAASVWIAGALIAGGAAVTLYGFVTREVSLTGATLRCGTPGRTLALADFAEARETTRTDRGPRNEFRGERVQLILAGPDGRMATCELYHRLAPADRERLLAEIRAHLNT
jgi:hypothetical protein